MGFRKNPHVFASLLFRNAKMARAHNVSTVTVTDCHIKGLKMEKKVKTGVTLMVAALLTLLGVWAQTKSLKRSPSNSFTQMEKLYTGQYSGPALAPDCDHQQTPRPRLAVYYVHSGSALREQCDLQRQVCPYQRRVDISVVLFLNTLSAGLLPSLQET